MEVRRIHHDRSYAISRLDDEMYILKTYTNIGVNEIKDHVDDAVLIIKRYCLKSSFDH